MLLQDRRALSRGGSVVLALWLMTRGIPDVVRAHERSRTAAALGAEQVARARAVLAEQPAERDSFAVSARRLVALAPRLLPGRSNAEAASALGSQVNGSADQARVRVVRVDPLPDSSAGVFSRVALRVEARGDVAGLARWIALLERGPPALRVKEVTISAADPTAPSDRPETLVAELVVAGWRMSYGPGRSR